MATVNEDFLDSMIKHKIQIERLSNGISDRVLKKIRDKILKSVNIDNLENMTQIEVNILSNKIETQVNEIIIVEYENMKQELVDLAQYEQKYIQNTATRLLPAAVTVNAITMDKDTIIENLKMSNNEIVSDVYKRIADKTSKEYKNQILNGYNNGLGSREVGRRIYNIESQGLTDATAMKKLKNEINTLSRTACNSINSEVNKEFFNQNDNLISGYLFTATLDGRTTSECGGLDGKFFQKGQEPQPPLHYNCRSILTPVLKSEAELGLSGTRRSMDGLVPKAETYEQWLSKKDRNFIEDVLGKKKAKLFIDNKIPLERFTDSQGRQLTLRELALREGIEL